MVGIVPISQKKKDITAYVKWNHQLMTVMISIMNGKGQLKTNILMTTIKGGNSPSFSAV